MAQRGSKVVYMATNSRDRESLILAVLAGQLRAEAARQRVSLRDLARNSGVPYPTVQKSLAGRRMIDVSELARLCQALHVSASTLFERAEAEIAEQEGDQGGVAVN